ncbi:hypothetical protein QQS21_011172 [Conoideocrella luteorostrata]|uniref:Kinesin light chain n=1 Tax=Conoideocrella luteorostrata TaxID=1105319 RepID=A0AAJ0FTJ6_9HYPO|nr:hypothetical protein QQS21_011172 [Conoideocrella luteorostrata]
MSKKNAVKLFQNKLNELGSRHDDDRTAELAEKLEYVPLAIVQAAAYISERWPRCSVEKYLEKCRKNNHSKTRVLNDNRGGYYHRDPGAKNSILTTWQISFDHVSQNRRSSADLLSLMSFCDRQGILEVLLRGHSALKNKIVQEESKADSVVAESNGSASNSDSDSDDDSFEEDILTLKSYSFISVNENGKTFAMHRRRFAGSNSVRNEGPVGRSRSVTRASEDARKETLGEDHPDTLESIDNLAYLYRDQGRYNEAEEPEVQVMETYEKNLGQDHDLTTRSKFGLSSTLWYKGEQDAAAALQVEVMETLKKKLGEKHPDTLSAMGQLAVTYRYHGRFEDATSLMRQCALLRRHTLGASHADSSFATKMAAQWERKISQNG